MKWNVHMSSKVHKECGYGNTLDLLSNHLTLILCFHILREVGAERKVSNEDPLISLMRIEKCMVDKQVTLWQVELPRVFGREVAVVTPPLVLGTHRYLLLSSRVQSMCYWTHLILYKDHNNQSMMCVWCPCIAKFLWTLTNSLAMRIWRLAYKVLYILHTYIWVVYGTDSLQQPPVFATR